jgi:group II intron reverse transcriptase/maturase
MNVSTKQQRIAELAKQRPEMRFTSLNHSLDRDWLREAYRRLRKESAPGYDGQTVADYGRDVETNLQSLLDRAKSGTYFAPPVRRVQIPKGTGTDTRPIGIPTTEDKLLQRAVVMLLEPIYEQDFLDCSYGFRPGRSAHGALSTLWQQCTTNGIMWILDVDISKFFDTLDQTHLRSFLQRRVRDGVITRLIGKWLKAGVLEQGVLHYPEAGTPQGGSASPLLSNLYLHYVLDLWFAQEVRPRLRGRAFMTRFADDVVMGFARHEDAERVLSVLPKRLGKYGLTLHPDKTRLVAFGRPTGTSGSTPGTFDFLGFTHYWGKSRQGKWIIKRKTAQQRFSRGLKRITEWCRHNRHKPIGEQHQELCQALRGHFAYYGITGNALWLRKFRQGVKRAWQKWLHRRSRSSTDMPWDRFNRLLQRYRLPPARVVHSIYAAKP